MARPRFVRCPRVWCAMARPPLHDMEKETTEIASLFTLYREICLVARVGNFDDPTGILTVEDKAYHFAQYCLLHTIVLKATDPRHKTYAISSFFLSFFLSFILTLRTLVAALSGPKPTTATKSSKFSRSPSQCLSGEPAL